MFVDFGVFIFFYFSAFADQPPKALCLCAVDPFVCVHVQSYTKVCEHVLLKTACSNFTKFITWVQFRTKMNRFDEIKRLKVKVTVGPDMVKKVLWES